MLKTKEKSDSGCLMRTGGILGSLAVAGVLSLFALGGFLQFGLSLSWLTGSKAKVSAEEVIRYR